MAVILLVLGQIQSSCRVEYVVGRILGRSEGLEVIRKVRVGESPGIDDRGTLTPESSCALNDIAPNSVQGASMGGVQLAATGNIG